MWVFIQIIPMCAKKKRHKGTNWRDCHLICIDLWRSVVGVEVTARRTKRIQVKMIPKAKSKQKNEEQKIGMQTANKLIYRYQLIGKLDRPRHRWLSYNLFICRHAWGSSMKYFPSVVRLSIVFSALFISLPFFVLFYLCIFFISLFSVHHLLGVFVHSKCFKEWRIKSSKHAPENVVAPEPIEIHWHWQ